MLKLPIPSDFLPEVTVPDKPRRSKPLPTGTCQICDLKKILTGDGKVADHVNFKLRGNCPGSGNFPLEKSDEFLRSSIEVMESILSKREEEARSIEFADHFLYNFRGKGMDSVALGTNTFEVCEMLPRSPGEKITIRLVKEDISLEIEGSQDTDPEEDEMMRATLALAAVADTQNLRDILESLKPIRDKWEGVKRKTRKSRRSKKGISS